jgi:hypothetical protein
MDDSGNDTEWLRADILPRKSQVPADPGAAPGAEKEM